MSVSAELKMSKRFYFLIKSLKLFNCKFQFLLQSFSRKMKKLLILNANHASFISSTEKLTKPMVVSSKKFSQKEIVIAQSPKGREILLYDGHKYVVSYREPKKTVWRCNSAAKFGCKAGATTLGHEIVLMREHNHPRITFPIHVVKLKNENQN